MLSVRGTFENGVARPQEPIEGYEGREVIITFVDEVKGAEEQDDLDRDWTRLMQLIQDSAVDTGIPDLSYQHDHYLHGKPKRD